MKNVYMISYNNIVVYIGKGTGNRINSNKNKWFNLFDKTLGFKREKVYHFETDKEAFTKESELIEKYQPIFNLVKGLSPQKWVKLNKISDKKIKKMSAFGAESPTPRLIAKQIMETIITNPDKYEFANILLYDRFGHKYDEFIKMVPNFKGKVTVINIDKSNDNLPNIKGNMMIVRDALTHDFGDEKFDLSLMNPPFKDGDSVLWDKFLTKLLPISETLVLIHPIKTTKAYKENHNRLVKIVDVNREVVFSHSCAISYFTGKKSQSHECVWYDGDVSIQESNYNDTMQLQVKNIGEIAYNELFTKHNNGIGLGASQVYPDDNTTISGIWRKNWDEYYFAIQTPKEAISFGSKGRMNVQQSKGSVYKIDKLHAKKYVKLLNLATQNGMKTNDSVGAPDKFTLPRLNIDKETIKNIKENLKINNFPIPR